MTSYLDTSFLTSLYLPDTNASRAISRMSEIPLPALLTTFGELEFINALQLGVFRKQLNNTQARAVYAAMRDDIRATVIAVHPVTDEMYAQSRRMATRWTPRLGVRSLDIIHVAAALELGADSFETFDKRQKQLAEAIGLRGAMRTWKGRKVMGVGTHQY